MFNVQKLNRRELLARLCLLVAGAVLNISPSNSIAGNRKNSRLVTISHPQATDGTGGKDNVNLNDDVVKLMVDEGIKAFTGKNNLVDAWSAIIPDPDKRVAIKVNCKIEGIYTKAKVVKPITDGLIQYGVNPDNIIIYDATENAFAYAGFIKNSGPGIKVGEVYPDFGGYHASLFNRTAKLLTGGYIFFESPYRCDYLINVPVLKAMDSFAGVTLSMKNHYGSIDNPQTHHEDIMTYIPYLNSLPFIREKTRLIVLDGIFINYRWVNGRDQSYVDILNKLLISDDPVAVDYVGWKIIEKKRQEHGLHPVSPEPVYIQNAANKGLGTINPSQINLNLGS